jgi:hypothetical protein
MRDFASIAPQTIDSAHLVMCKWLCCAKSRRESCTDCFGFVGDHQ